MQPPHSRWWREPPAHGGGGSLSHSKWWWQPLPLTVVAAAFSFCTGKTSSITLTSLFQELSDNLDRQCLPSGIFEVKSNSSIVFSSMVISEDRPVLAFSIIIKDDMNFKMWIRDREVPFDDIIHLAPMRQIETCAQLLNILAFLKSSDMPNGVCKPPINQCISLLEKVESEAGDADITKVPFLREQLQLTTQVQKRYSPELLATAAIWQMTSPSLYKTILQEGLLSLPSVRYTNTFRVIGNIFTTN